MISKDNIKKYAPDFLCATAISLLVGIVCGLVGTFFVKSISAVTLLRENNGWILYLLPIFGLILTFIYNKLNVKGVGTNNIIKSVRTDEKTSPLLSVVVFCGTVSPILVVHQLVVRVLHFSLAEASVSFRQEPLRRLKIQDEFL